MSVKFQFWFERIFLSQVLPGLDIREVINIVLTSRCQTLMTKQSDSRHLKLGSYHILMLLGIIVRKHDCLLFGVKDRKVKGFFISFLGIGISKLLDSFFIASSLWKLWSKLILCFLPNLQYLESKRIAMLLGFQNRDVNSNYVCFPILGTEKLLVFSKLFTDLLEHFMFVLFL